MKLPLISSTIALVCLGCAEDGWKADYDFEWRGKYVTVYGYDRDEGQVCGESLQATDDYVRTLLDFHGSDAAIHFGYRWMTHSAWDDAGLPEVAGFYADGDVFSVQIPHAHELSHAVDWSVYGRSCTPVLEEGLAVVLADAVPGSGDYGEFDLDIEELLVFTGSASGDEYHRSGHFVAFLLEAYGIENFGELCQLVPRTVDITLGDWDAATRSALGLSLDEVLTAYAAYPACNHHQYRARLRDCAGDPDVIVSAVEPTEFSFRFACDEPDVLGEAEGRMRLVRRVEVPVAGEYAIEVDDGSPAGERKVEAIHEQCASCSQAPLYGEIEDVPLYTSGSPCAWVYEPAQCGYHQLAGMHTFVFFLDEGLDRDVTVRIVPTDLP